MVGGGPVLVVTATEFDLAIDCQWIFQVLSAAIAAKVVSSTVVDDFSNFVAIGGIKFVEQITKFFELVIICRHVISWLDSGLDFDSYYEANFIVAID